MSRQRYSFTSLKGIYKLNESDFKIFDNIYLLNDSPHVLNYIKSKNNLVFLNI